LTKQSYAISFFLGLSQTIFSPEKVFRLAKYAQHALHLFTEQGQVLQFKYVHTCY